MPRRDGTGPMGRGTMSGKGMGFCNESKFINGMGMGAGCRGSRRMGFRSNINLEDEKSILNSQKNLLENDLNSIKERLEVLEK